MSSDKTARSCYLLAAGKEISVCCDQSSDRKGTMYEVGKIFIFAKEQTTFFLQDDWNDSTQHNLKHDKT
jgi:hypothetical protein